MAELAVILGLSGPVLTESERAFFRDANPWAFILFARNIETPKQVKKLCEDIRGCVGRDCLIFVDQEGGRVQRLKTPHWPLYPAASKFGELYTISPHLGRRASYLAYRLIADDLRAVGITADCAPVLDLPQADADPIISDRAFSQEIDPAIDMANSCMAGLMNGGIAPVIKHIPGHGRATVDSHKALPVISTSRELLEKTDFKTFQALKDAPMAMTAHAVYTSHSSTAVTVSKSALKSLIRDAIGFDGLVMSDDLDMKALKGTLTRKTERALAAGCDVALQCSGVLPDMVEVVKGAKNLEGKAKSRAAIADYCAGMPLLFERDEAEREFSLLMKQVL
ncbi:beta-N-acetylhexosaminidase [Litorimonas taeanensis]|uniref:beta-N-acetylhexosaminidase n=1 Tax=Litorimonas taeanensis TaxID=568099 RepID=A0A420WKL6_9PROT|nr:beta-N-acetylhexosaminidase [Litorimonas taeanensis]RKQ71540.1 beta-N-acetylhexosaminidase [Litorimonas taeanensis]